MGIEGIALVGPEPEATAEAVEASIKPYHDVVTRLGKPTGRRVALAEPAVILPRVAVAPATSRKTTGTTSNGSVPTLHLADDANGVATIAADIVASTIERRPDAVLALPTGRTPIPLYHELAVRYRAGRIDFARARAFNLDEWVGVPPRADGSFTRFMDEHLFSQVNLPRENWSILNGLAADLEAECRRYEVALQAAGGLDLAILGLGRNGHIGFNEPGTPFDSRTHVVDVMADTRRANAYMFSDREPPARGLSMGIATILGARVILLLVIGREKAAILARALNGPVDESVPERFFSGTPTFTSWPIARRRRSWRRRSAARERSRCGSAFITAGCERWVVAKNIVARSRRACRPTTTFSLLTHEPVDLDVVGRRLGLPLGRVRLRVVRDDVEFTAAREASAEYDLFVNASHLDFFVPRAPRNILIVYFPATSLASARALGSYNRSKRLVRTNAGRLMGSGARAYLRRLAFGTSGRSSDQTVAGRLAIGALRLVSRPAEQAELPGGYPRRLRFRPSRNTGSPSIGDDRVTSCTHRSTSDAFAPATSATGSLASADSSPVATTKSISPSSRLFAVRATRGSPTGSSTSPAASPQPGQTRRISRRCAEPRRKTPESTCTSTVTTIACASSTATVPSFGMPPAWRRTRRTSRAVRALWADDGGSDGRRLRAPRVSSGRPAGDRSLRARWNFVVVS